MLLRLLCFGSPLVSDRVRIPVQLGRRGIAHAVGVHTVSRVHHGLRAQGTTTEALSQAVAHSLVVLQFYLKGKRVVKRAMGIRETPVASRQTTPAIGAPKREFSYLSSVDTRSASDR